MRRPRWTTRRIMAAMLALGTAMGLTVPAVKVARDRRDHVFHCFRHPTTPAEAAEQERQERLNVLPPPWLHYWRHLRGVPVQP